MSLTYEQKRAILHHLAQKALWREEPVMDRLLALYEERRAAGGTLVLRYPSNPSPEEAAEAARNQAEATPDSNALWSHLSHVIDLPHADFPWLSDGTGTDKLKLVTAYDLGIDRSMTAESMARKLGENATTAFVPWTLTTEFNGCNIGFSNRFSMEPYTDDNKIVGIRLRTDATGKYAILAKTQLCEQARQGACPVQDWTGGLMLLAALKGLAAAPALTIAGGDRNIWRAFELHASDPAGLRAALTATHDTLGRNLGLDAASYAAVNYGGGKILVAVEQGEYERLAAAAAISMRALHAIRTGQCDDWQSLGRAMAAQGADLKYADPDAALGNAAKLGEKGVKCFTDLMIIYDRDELLQAYEGARDERNPGPPAPPAP